MYELISTDGKIFELRDRVSRLGREACQITFTNDQKISRIHAEFEVAGEHLIFRDLHSTNGSTVNGEKVFGEVVLTPGDVIRVGDTSIALRRSADTNRAERSPNLIRPDLSPPPPPVNSVGPPPPPVDCAFGGSPAFRNPSPPGQIAPIPIAGQSGRPPIPSKSRALCMILEILPALLGIHGIGWIYAGRIAVGVSILFAGLVFGFFVFLLGLLSSGLAFVLTFPIWLVGTGLSALVLYGYIKKRQAVFA